MNSRGLDKTRFAAYLRVDRSTVSRWLSGTVIPGHEHLGLLAERLDRPYAEILNLARADTRARRSGQKAEETLAEEVPATAGDSPPAWIATVTDADVTPGEVFEGEVLWIDEPRRTVFVKDCAVARRATAEGAPYGPVDGPGFAYICQ